jgi:hypothetical protein
MALKPAKATRQVNLIMALDSSSIVTLAEATLADLVVVAGSPRESASERSRQPTTATSASSPTLLFAPLQELAEQRLAISLALRRTGSDAIQEGLEIAIYIFLS